MRWPSSAPSSVSTRAVVDRTYDLPSMNFNAGNQTDDGNFYKNRVGYLSYSDSEAVSVARFDIGPAQGKKIPSAPGTATSPTATRCSPTSSGSGGPTATGTRTPSTGTPAPRSLCRSAVVALRWMSLAVRLSGDDRRQPVWRSRSRRDGERGLHPSVVDDAIRFRRDYGCESPSRLLQLRETTSPSSSRTVVSSP